MSKSWRVRLIDAIKRDQRSARQISLEAGLGPNFVGDLTREGKDPSAENLVKLTATLGVSLTYIFTGADMTPEAEEMLQLAAGLPKEKQELVLDLLRGLQPSSHG